MSLLLSLGVSFPKSHSASYLTNLISMSMKRKFESGALAVVPYGEEKRSRGSALASKVNALAKKLKLAAPLHMISISLSGLAVTSAGLATDICTNISGSDEYFGRHGTVTHSRRAILKGVLIPGTTAATPSTVRIVICRGQVGSTVAQLCPDLFANVNPIADNRIEQLYCDQYFTVAPTNAGQSFPTKVSMSCKLYNHRVNYTGSANGTNTGSTIFFLVLSDKAAGTTAPSWSGGQLSHWFNPA